MLAVERSLIIAPHLRADAQGLLQPLEALGQRREEQAQAAGLLLVPGGPDAEHRPAARQDIKGRHRPGPLNDLTPGAAPSRRERPGCKRAYLSRTA